MKGILVIFFFISTFISFSQKKYEFSGYHIKFGNVVYQNDSIINYRLGNVIFQPKKKLTKRKILKIKKLFKTKKDFFLFLEKNGVVYYIIPKVNNIAFLEKYYDTLRIKKIFDNKNWDCLSFLPDNLIENIEIEKIEFNGLMESFEKSILREIYPQLNNEFNLPIMIETIDYLSNPDKKIIEKKRNKRIFFDFTLHGIEHKKSILTIMIFDCKKNH